MIVDDVAMTGAMLDEAARALEEADFVVAGCAVAAVTPWRPRGQEAPPGRMPTRPR